MYYFFPEYGYLTGFTEDGVHEGPFQYRLTGFTDPPTDFYPRPYFLNVGSKTKTKTDRCINNRNINEIHVNYVRAVFDAFPDKLKFFTSFSGMYLDFCTVWMVVQEASSRNTPFD